MINKLLTSLKTYRYLFLLYLVVAILLIANALFEMRQSKKELLELMKNQSEATLHSVIMSSENLIKNNFQTQKIIEHHLARTLMMFYAFSQKSELSDQQIETALKNAQIGGLLFLDSTYTPFLLTGLFKDLTLDQLNHFLDKAFALRTISGDTVFWQERFINQLDSSAYRLGCVFLPGGEVLMLIGKASLSHFPFKQSDFGTLIRALASEVPNIIFLALEDTSNIIAAAGKLQYLTPPITQTILQAATSNNPVTFRILDFDSLRIFEADHPFYYRRQNIGLFRLGLSTSALESINQRIYRRLTILSLVLIGFALLIVTCFCSSTVRYFTQAIHHY